MIQKLSKHKLAYDEFVNKLRNDLKEILLNGAKKIFNDNPQLESFGWHQFIAANEIDKYIIYENSIDHPDISGALGDMIYANNSSYPLQLEVAKYLREFDPLLLITVFGRRVEITVYKDNTIEINDYDYYRSMVK